VRRRVAVIAAIGSANSVQAAIERDEN